MNLLVYMYPLSCTSIIKRDDQEVTYTIKGRVYTTISELIKMEVMVYNYQDNFTRHVTPPVVAKNKYDLMKRKVGVPIVAFGLLNFLYYSDGHACLRYYFDEYENKH